MALTATASQGFEPFRLVAPDEIVYAMGDPGDTYTRGDIVTATVGEGVVDLLAAGEDFIGVVDRTIVCPVKTQALPAPGDFDPWRNAEKDKCLIPVKGIAAPGTQVFLVTFASHLDDTVISYVNGATAYAALTTGATADDYPNGALVYVYEGTGKGQVNVVEDYDETGGTVEKMLVFHRPFAVALDSTSKIIIVSGEAVASRGIGFFNRADAGDQNNLVANDGSNDGEWLVYADYRTIGSHLAELKLPVIRAAAVTKS